MFQVAEDLSYALVYGGLGGLAVDFGVLGRLVGLVETADVGDFSAAEATVDAGGIALPAERERGVDVDFDKGANGCPDRLPGEAAGAHGGDERDDAVAAEQRGE